MRETVYYTVLVIGLFQHEEKNRERVMFNCIPEFRIKASR